MNLQVNGWSSLSTLEQSHSWGMDLLVLKWSTGGINWTVVLIYDFQGEGKFCLNDFPFNPSMKLVYIPARKVTPLTLLDRTLLEKNVPITFCVFRLLCFLILPGLRMAKFPGSGKF